MTKTGGCCTRSSAAVRASAIGSILSSPGEFSLRTAPTERPNSVAAAIRQVAAAHGQPDRFHETITRSWVRCVAVHRERWPAATFGEFLDRNPRLLDPGLLGHFYSPGLLASPEARGQWVAPDRHALPTTSPRGGHERLPGLPVLPPA